MSRKFKKVIEPFMCEQCGADVQSNGYTNHCPECLWGKHVDIYPGDRAEGCGGLMKPVAIEVKKGEQRIIHRCVRCGSERANRVSEADNSKAIVELSAAE